MPKTCWVNLKVNKHLYLCHPLVLSSPSYILFIIIFGGILVLFIYITRLASNEIFSPSNKIHREVGRAKDLSAPLYFMGYSKYPERLQPFWKSVTAILLVTGLYSPTDVPLNPNAPRPHAYEAYAVFSLWSTFKVHSTTPSCWFF